MWLAGKFTIWLDDSPMNTSYLIWLVVWLPRILLSQKYWECRHPNWRTHIFQKGWRKTSKQWWSVLQFWRCFLTETSISGGCSRRVWATDARGYTWSTAHLAKVNSTTPCWPCLGPWNDKGGLRWVICWSWTLEHHHVWWGNASTNGYVVFNSYVKLQNGYFQ